MAAYKRVSTVLKGIKSSRIGGMDGGGLPAPSGRLSRRLTRTHFRAAATGNAQSRSAYGGQQNCAGGNSAIQDRRGRSTGQRRPASGPGDPSDGFGRLSRHALKRLLGSLTRASLGRSVVPRSRAFHPCRRCHHETRQGLPPASDCPPYELRFLVRGTGSSFPAVVLSPPRRRLCLRDGRRSRAWSLCTSPCRRWGAATFPSSL